MTARAHAASWGAGILALLALSGCSRSGGTASGGPPRATVRAALERTYLMYAPLLLAQSEGFFADEGLDVEFLRVDKADEALPALIAGEIDVLPGVVYPALLRAMAQGARVRIVSDKGYLAKDGCTSTAVVLRHGIRPEEASVRVRRIVVSRAGPSRFLATGALAAEGIDLEQIETVVLPPPVVGEALHDGSVDAAVLTEPWLSRFRGTYSLWLPVEHALPDQQVGVLIYGERLLGPDRELGRRFMRAFRRGVTRYNEGKTARNLATLARETGQDQSVLESSCWPVMHPDGRVNLPSLMAFQDWALKRGFLDVPVSPDQVWDPAFLAEVESARAGLPERE